MVVVCATLSCPLRSHTSASGRPRRRAARASRDVRVHGSAHHARSRHARRTATHAHAHATHAHVVVVILAHVVPLPFLRIRQDGVRLDDKLELLFISPL